MKNKWTTLVDDHAADAAAETHDEISTVLNGNSTAAATHNKKIAIAMAALGVVLIILGLIPFFSAGNLTGDISGEGAETESFNIFEADTSGEGDAETPVEEDVASEEDLMAELEALLASGDAELLPVESDDSSLLALNDLLAFDGVENEPVDTLAFNNEAESIDLSGEISFGEMNEESSDTEEEIAMETPMESVEINMEEDAHSAAPENDESEENTEPSFKENTHTGTTDELVVFGDGADVSVENADQTHAAANEMVDSGPAEWFAVCIALGLALIMRRKKLFA